MKKIPVIFAVVFVFLFVNFVYGQDCGKCPFKCKAAKEAQQTVKNEKITDPVVYVNKGDRMYHQKNCKAVKEGYKEAVLSEAVKADLKPCTECKPPLKSVLFQKNPDFLFSFSIPILP